MTKPNPKKQPKSLTNPAAGGDKIVKTRGVDQNITGRKRAEEALRELSERNEAILQTVPDIIAEVDRNRVYVLIAHSEALSYKNSIFYNFSCCQTGHNEAGFLIFR